MAKKGISGFRPPSTTERMAKMGKLSNAGVKAAPTKRARGAAPKGKGGGGGGGG